MDDVRKARAKVRERERAICTHVGTFGREARAADSAIVQMSEVEATDTSARKEKQAQTLGSGS